MTHYHIFHIMTYYYIFLRKLTFSEATIRKVVLFLFEVTFVCPTGYAGYEFGDPKG